MSTTDNPALLLQDCNRGLALWFATRPGARYALECAMKESVMDNQQHEYAPELDCSPTPWWAILFFSIGAIAVSVLILLAINH